MHGIVTRILKSVHNYGYDGHVTQLTGASLIAAFHSHVQESLEKHNNKRNSIVITKVLFFIQIARYGFAQSWL